MTKAAFSAQEARMIEVGIPSVIRNPVLWIEKLANWIGLGDAPAGTTELNEQLQRQTDIAEQQLRMSTTRRDTALGWGHGGDGFDVRNWMGIGK